MRYVKWAFWTTLILTIGSFLHYTLPQHDVVRVVGTYQERQDLNDWTRIFWSSPDDQSSTLVNRDVQFIQTIQTNGRPMVYRNEDTGWGWPPYFKFDTASLQTEADDLKSTAETPKWAVVTHYGWRNELISVFPNAVGIRLADGPDERIIPWFNIFFFVALLLLAFLLRKMWLQFRERMIDPALADAGEAWDSVEARAETAKKEARGFFGRTRAWINTWRAKK
ncbi:DUF1523 family protein [Tabrizicola sp.]|uniref:DUF1523 family protein n=1 Tax=Tabrizicola sp. TaxID=2005166 RepID=UPI0026147790|nr:DUF1523 family protein [Tabrizicola sp.]MDM7932531.1 DUF1523 family protein [Tabrizicola sp.]